MMPWMNRAYLSSVCTRKVSDNCSKSNPKYTNRVKLCITLILKLLPQEFIVSKVEKRVQTEIFGA